MTRPAARRIAACLLTGLLAMAGTALPGVAAAPAAAASTSSAPLEVSIESLAPSAIPRHGRITITGRITNRSDETWTNLQAYMFTSSSPMRTSEELDAASHTDPIAEVGSRIYQPGLYDEVGDLDPGQSTNYVLSVPRRALQITGQPGVYWVGVHVLGGDVNGRDGIADGRARTFMPLMRPRGPSTSMSLVVPFEAQVNRLPDGKLADPEVWKRELRPNGRLNTLLTLCATSSLPLTFVVDPAVLDAAASVAAGNPAVNVARAGSSTSSPSPSASSSPTPSPSGPTSPAVPGRPDIHPTSPDAQAAAEWLRELQTQAAVNAVLAVPYGELDVSSALRHGDASMYRRAKMLSTATLHRFGLTGSPAVAPPLGFLPPDAVHQLSGSTTVLLSDRAAPGAPGPVLGGGPTGTGLISGTGGAAAAERTRPSVVLIDSTASSGGPGPTPRFAALAVRQRILSEAAVHALSPDRGQPLVVSTPQLWNPGPDWRTADFFAGLEAPWLSRVDVPTVLATGSVPGTAAEGALVYPRFAQRAELPTQNLQASRELVHTGTVLAGLLPDNPAIGSTLAKVAMVDSSARAREHAPLARDRATSAAHRLRALMGRVRIDGPSFVTMSSEEGTFSVTLVNGLEQPVTVGVQAHTGSPGLTITSPDPVTIGPGQRASVRLHANAHDIGVHSVTLLPTNAHGVPVATGTRFNVRSSQVGLVIWIIMGVGAGVLLLASAFRIVRRVRRRGRAGSRAAS